MIHRIFDTLHPLDPRKPTVHLFWEELLSYTNDHPSVAPPVHCENGIFYPANTARSVGYMMKHLNGFHDFILLDCEYHSGLRARSRYIENGVSHEYRPATHSTLLLRFYAASVYATPIVELVFTGVNEWNIRGNLQTELFGADITVETHPQFGRGILFKTDRGDSVFAKTLRWQKLSSEFYFNGAILLERSPEKERNILKTWVDTFITHKTEWHARLDFAEEKCGGDMTLWDTALSLRHLDEWLSGDAAREAFDAAVYDRALIFKTAYYSRREEKIRLEEPCLIGKVSHTEFENLANFEDIYIVSEDFRWTYIHTHEAEFGPFFRRTEL